MFVEWGNVGGHAVNSFEERAPEAAQALANAESQWIEYSPKDQCDHLYTTNGGQNQERMSTCTITAVGFFQ